MKYCWEMINISIIYSKHPCLVYYEWQTGHRCSYGLLLANGQSACVTTLSFLRIYYFRLKRHNISILIIDYSWPVLKYVVKFVYIINIIYCVCYIIIMINKGHMLIWWKFIPGQIYKCYIYLTNYLFIYMLLYLYQI